MNKIVGGGALVSSLIDLEKQVLCWEADLAETFLCQIDPAKSRKSSTYYFQYLLIWQRVQTRMPETRPARAPDDLSFEIPIAIDKKSML